jgi:hypothetical protein
MLHTDLILEVLEFTIAKFPERDIFRVHIRLLSPYWLTDVDLCVRAKVARAKFVCVRLVWKGIGG